MLGALLIGIAALAVAVLAGALLDAVTGGVVRHDQPSGSLQLHLPPRFCG